MKKLVSSLALVSVLSFNFFSSTADAAESKGHQFLDLKTQAVVSETEPNNTFETAKQVASEDDVTGTLIASDSDFYKFTSSTKGYLFLLGTTESTVDNVNITIYDSNKNVVTTENYSDAEGYFTSEGLLNSGTYYIKLTAENNTMTGETYNFSFVIAEPGVKRLSGADRYETATKIAYDGWASGAEEIILATGKDFPDALAAAPLAYDRVAPILLTEKYKLPTSVQTLIKDLEVQRVTIIGGTNAVSQQVEDYLRNTLKLAVTRIAGVDRYDTAVKISNALPASTRAIVVNGKNYPDALSVASYAALSGYPILLSEPTKLPSPTANKLKSFNETLVVGGPNAISSTVYSKLPRPTRISGQDRYETSAKVAELIGTKFAFVATGTQFADALSGSALAALYAEPIVLTPPTALHASSKQYLQNNEVWWFTVLGGTSAISSNVENELLNLTK